MNKRKPPECDEGFAVVVPLVAGVLDRLTAELPEIEGASLLRKLAERIAPSLRAAGYVEYAEAFESTMEIGEAAATSWPSDLEFAVGAGAGEFFGRNPEDVGLTVVRHILEALPTAFKAFDVAAEAALHRTPGAVEVLVATLRKRASDFVAGTGECSFAYPPTPNAPLELLRTSRRIIDAWEGAPGTRPFFVRDVFAYDLLLRTDHKAYLREVEALPLPGLVQSILNSTCRRESLAELCLLLRDAGPAFSAEGAWIEENTVPFLLLAACTERLSGTPEANGLGSENYIGSAAVLVSDRVCEILHALAARPDAVALGYAWMQYLIWSSHARGRWRKDTAASPSDDLLVVLQQLGAWLPPHLNAEKWVEDEQELWRNDRIYAIVGVLLAHDAEERMRLADFVGRVLERDLASSFGVDRLASELGSPERHIIGAALAAIPNTADWFMELWAKLFHLRDRARRYLHGRDSRTQTNIGQVAVMWGLCGLGLIEPASGDARALWVRLEAAARESILMDGIRRAGSGCLNSFALEISGFLPGFLGWCFGSATQGGRSPTAVARPKHGEVHAAALCGRGSK